MRVVHRFLVQVRVARPFCSISSNPVNPGRLIRFLPCLVGRIRPSFLLFCGFGPNPNIGKTRFKFFAVFFLFPLVSALSFLRFPSATGCLASIPFSDEFPLFFARSSIDARRPDVTATNSASTSVSCCFVDSFIIQLVWNAFREPTALDDIRFMPDSFSLYVLRCYFFLSRSVTES